MVKTLTSNAGDAGLILGLGAEIPRTSGPKKSKHNTKQYCKKLKKDLKKTTRISGSAAGGMNSIPGQGSKIPPILRAAKTNQPNK